MKKDQKLDDIDQPFHAHPDATADCRLFIARHATSPILDITIFRNPPGIWSGR